MRKIIYSITLCIGILALVSCEKDALPIIKSVEQLEPQAVSKSNTMKLYMHYMPWFETSASNENGWGSHWTMGNKNPETIVDGKREIASHYYPLIGPYASSDEVVIEYHLLLMKYSGIDGILIDWYGVSDRYDYPENKKNTEVIVKVLQKVGLEFAIVYEDQTLRDLDAGEKLQGAKADMKYLEDNFFNKSNYIKVDGNPLLMVFGPQTIDAPADWTNVLSSLKQKPKLVTLYAHSQGKTNDSEHKNAQGEFIWVDATAMDKKYATKDNFDLFVGGAYPGFKDFYKEGNWGEQVLAPIDHKNGDLLKELLQMAKTEKMNYLQLITWNDFGEGTMIEPTQEFGYKFLNEIQSFAGVSYDTKILESIYELYNLRVKNKGKVKKEKKLAQAFYYYVSLQEGKANELIQEVKNEN